MAQEQERAADERGLHERLEVRQACCELREELALGADSSTIGLVRRRTGIEVRARSSSAW
jgi:hypothetical protein